MQALARETANRVDLVCLVHVVEHAVEPSNGGFRNVVPSEGCDLCESMLNGVERQDGGQCTFMVSSTPEPRRSSRDGWEGPGVGRAASG